MIVVLILASAIAFAVSRFSFRFNLVLLMLFTAGNLLPAQVIITPLYRMYLALPLPAPLSTNGVWYDQYFGIMMIHIAFQLGFCTFVLSNYMKTLPKELTEAALVDGASVLRTFWQVILPLCKPPLAALATLEVTFIYNDFFWALVLMFTGDKRPITSSLNDLTGPVLRGQQPPGGGRRHHRGADPHRVLHPPGTVRPRPDAGLDQGLTRVPCRPGSVAVGARFAPGAHNAGSEAQTAADRTEACARGTAGPDRCPKWARTPSELPGAHLSRRVSSFKAPLVCFRWQRLLAGVTATTRLRPALEAPGHASATPRRAGTATPGSRPTRRRRAGRREGTVRRLISSSPPRTAGVGRGRSASSVRGQPLTR